MTTSARDTARIDLWGDVVIAPYKVCVKLKLKDRNTYG